MNGPTERGVTMAEELAMAKASLTQQGKLMAGMRKRAEKAERLEGHSRAAYIEADNARHALLRESASLRARVAVLEQQIGAIEAPLDMMASEDMWLAVQEYFEQDSPWYDPHKGLWAAGVILRDWMRRAALAAGVGDNPTEARARADRLGEAK